MGRRRPVSPYLSTQLSGFESQGDVGMTPRSARSAAIQHTSESGRDRKSDRRHAPARGHRRIEDGSTPLVAELDHCSVGQRNSEEFK